MEGRTPRILLTSGIFFPDIGGPAIHVRKIADHLTTIGWKVTVIAFGDHAQIEPYRVIRITRRLPKPLSWLNYSFAIVREALRHDVVYGFDLTTAGLPSACITRLLGKPFLLRIGGDPIWERIVEKGRRFLPMRAYYEARLYRRDKPLLYLLIRFVVRSANRVITYSTFLNDIYVEHYGVRTERMLIIPNPVIESNPSPKETETFTFLFAGRFVLYKNLARVIRVFGRIAAGSPNVRLELIGNGPEFAGLKEAADAIGSQVRLTPTLPQPQLFERIKASSVALAPALTEFNPNFILESLSLGKVAIISRDNSLSIPLPESLQFDPLDDASLERAMRSLIDQETYAQAVTTIQHLPPAKNWNEVVTAHESLLREITD